MSNIEINWTFQTKLKSFCN